MNKGDVDRMQSILSVLPLLLCQVSLTLLVNVVSGQTSAKVSSIVRTTDNDQVPNAVDTSDFSRQHIHYRCRYACRRVHAKMTCSGSGRVVCDRFRLVNIL